MFYLVFYFFFFNATATSEIYTLSLHDALPISMSSTVKLSNAIPFPLVSSSHSFLLWFSVSRCVTVEDKVASFDGLVAGKRSEEYTSELQSPDHLVCRLLLEKKKNKVTN